MYPAPWPQRAVPAATLTPTHLLPRSLLLIAAALLLITAPTLAHPGNVAGDGCHYCRTNCDSWGVPWNERHCHGGAPSAPVPAPTPSVSADSPVGAQRTVLATVTRVVDGDTIDVEHEGETLRVRILGIDTPETVDPRKPVQCFGHEASEKLRELVLRKEVTLRADPVGDTIDRYSRLIRSVQSPDGAVDYGAELIRQGYAYAYLTYPFTPALMERYADLEREAREAGRGLWAPDACGEASPKAEDGAPNSDEPFETREAGSSEVPPPPETAPVLASTPPAQSSSATPVVVTLLGGGALLGLYLYRKKKGPEA